MRKLEIKPYEDPDTKMYYNAIFVDEEVFDWGMELPELVKAAMLCRKDPFMKKSIEGDIQKHFIESFSEFIGYNVNLRQIINAIESGEIQ